MLSKLGDWLDWENTLMKEQKGFRASCSAIHQYQILQHLAINYSSSPQGIHCAGCFGGPKISIC